MKTLQNNEGMISHRITQKLFTCRVFGPYALKRVPEHQLFNKCINMSICSKYEPTKSITYFQ